MNKKLKSTAYGNYKLGLISAILCAVIWGILPIYWNALRPISSEVIILYRIVFVAITCFIIAAIKYGLSEILLPLKKPKLIARLFLSGAIITINWSIYIWAVNSGFILQTSIGYYMEPLLVCLFGVVLFNEKFNKYRVSAVILAALGVIYSVLNFGHFPVVAIALAFSFGVYAALKKSFSGEFSVRPVISLFYETIFLVPFAIVAIVFVESRGLGALSVGVWWKCVLLVFTGFLTALPLGLFAVAANNLPLITLGITEYISPSIGLIIGIFIYNEPFGKVQLVTFILIWIALIIFTIGEKRYYYATKSK